MVNFCPNCGGKLEESSKFCSYCGYKIQSTNTGSSGFENEQAPSMGYSEPTSATYQQPTGQVNSSGFTSSPKEKIVAGILAILVGGLGIHKFYLGNIGMGIVYIIFSWTGIPSLIGLIEGIIYLTKTDEQFYLDHVAPIEAKNQVN